MVTLAYFYTRLEAQMARGVLSQAFKVSEPTMVTARNGRPWRFEVTLPVAAGYREPSEVEANRVLTIVRRYAGMTYDKEQP